MNRYSLLLVLGMFAMGCGGAEVKKVTGTLLLDGQPLAGVSVCFWPCDDARLGIIVCNRTSPEGRFDITPDPEFGDGRAGRYAVKVSSHKDMLLMLDPRMLAHPEVAALALGRPLLHPKYGNEETTPLEAEIRKGVNELEPFQLHSEPLRPGKPKKLRTCEVKLEP